MLHTVDQDSPHCLVFAAALGCPHLRQARQLGAPGELPHVGSWRLVSSSSGHQGPQSVVLIQRLLLLCLRDVTKSGRRWIIRVILTAESPL